jgi:peptidoglycan/LPS O-acetylase OafA/YrhL
MKRLVSTSRDSVKGFRPDIEGLRGIAVLLVVLFHSGVPGFRGGYIGVDVFFVVSGYLITQLIVAEIRKTSKFSFKNFYARRVRRLLPASGLMVIGVLLAERILYSPLELSRYAIWGTYTSLYSSNFMFMREATRYFAGKAVNNPFLHTWSLAVEEQFYLFWPALIATMLLHPRFRRRMPLCLFGVTLLSLAASVWVTHFRQPWAFFSLPTRAWEFGAGGLACLLPQEFLAGKEKWITFTSWAGFLVLLASGHFFSSVEGIFPGYVAILPVAGTLAILLEGAAGAPSITQRILAWSVMQWLGKLSYSWYLWHWPFLIFAKTCVPDLTWISRLVVAIGALLMAQITYWIVENPVRFHPRLMMRPALSLSLAVWVPAVGISVALLMNHAASKALFTGEQQKIESAANSKRPWHACMVPFGEERLRECVFGDKTSNTDVVLLGDSHAGQWYPAMESIAEEKHWRLVTLLKANCQIAALEAYPDGRALDPACQAWRKKALDRITVLHPAVLVLGESATGVANPRMSARPVSPQEWEDGLRHELSTWGAMKIKTLVIADIPYAPYDVPVCLSRLAAEDWGAKACVIARSIGLNEKVRKAEVEAVGDDTDARWADMSSLFCSATECKTVVDGFVAYRDDNHISEQLARHLAQRLDHEIELLEQGDKSSKTPHS